MGRYIYRTIDLRTEKGIGEAERLKKRGAKIISGGLDTIQFEIDRQAPGAKGDPTMEANVLEPWTMTLPQYRDALKKWLRETYPDADREGIAMQMKLADRDWASAVERRAEGHVVPQRVIDCYLGTYGESAFRAFRFMPGIENYIFPSVRRQKRQIFTGRRRAAKPRLTR